MCKTSLEEGILLPKEQILKTIGLKGPNVPSCSDTGIQHSSPSTGADGHQWAKALFPPGVIGAFQQRPAAVVMHCRGFNL